MPKSMPSSAGARPTQQRAATGDELLLEHLSEQEGWAVLDERGQKLNPPLATAPALAYYLRRHRLAGRVSNLDVLPFHLQSISKSASR